MEYCPLSDSGGNYIGAILGIQDITAHTQIEESIWKNEKFGLRLLNNLLNPFLVIDPDTSIKYVNPAFEKLTGFPLKEIIGKKVPYPYWRQEELEHAIAEFERATSGGVRKQEELFRRKDNSLFWVQVNLTPVVRNREVEYYLSNWVDITARKQTENMLKKASDDLELRVKERTEDLMAVNEQLQQQIRKRRRAEKALIRSREQLRGLSAHLQSVREEERTRIAREIHDELGQSLTALKMNSSWLYNHLPKNQKQLLGKLTSMSEIIDSTIKTVKRVSTELRPGLLDDLGVVAAIEWQANRFQETTGIQCEIDSNLTDIDLDKERSTAIFRIFQETITNIVRHANATKVKISLKVVGNNLQLIVRDNGIGITKNQISGNESLGILGMRERARPFGGAIKLKGIQGKGTAITVAIPLNIKEQPL